MPTGPAGRFSYVQGCVNRVDVRWNDSAGIFGQWTPNNCPLSGPSSAEESTLLVMKGYVTALRANGGDCPWFGWTPCFKYDGGVSVQLEPIDGELKLKASRYVVINSGAVTFTAIIPSFEGQGMPREGITWQWAADSGGNTVSPCANGEMSCTKTINQSGTMTVSGLINGVSKSASVHIRVLCDSTDVPELNSLPVLDLLKDVWDAGWAEEPENRRERGGRVKCDANNVCMGEVDTLMDSATPCGTVLRHGDSTTKVYGHNHGLDTTESVPASCYENEQQLAAGNAEIGSGLSKEDYDFASARPTGRTFCAMDVSAIYCIPTGLTRENAELLMKRIPRVKNCGRLVLRERRHDKSHLYATEIRACEGHV